LKEERHLRLLNGAPPSYKRVMKASMMLAAVACVTLAPPSSSFVVMKMPTRQIGAPPPSLRGVAAAHSCSSRRRAAVLGMQMDEERGREAAKEVQKAVLRSWSPGLQLPHSVLSVAESTTLTKKVETMAQGGEYKEAAAILFDPSKGLSLPGNEQVRLWRLLPEVHKHMEEAYEAAADAGGDDKLSPTRFAMAAVMTSVAEHLGMSGEHEEASSLLEMATMALTSKGGGGKAGDDDERLSLQSDGFRRIAQCRAAIGDYEGAREVQMRNILMREDAHGEDSPQVCRDVLVMAGIARQCGQVDEAFLLCLRALKAAKALCPEAGVDGGDEGRRLLCEVKAETAWVQLDQGLLQAALEGTQQVLRMAPLVHGEDSPAAATAMDAVGLVMQKLGRYDEAREQHMRALLIKQQSLGQGHVDVAQTLSHLGACANDGDADFAKGREWHEKALAILQAELPSLHPLIGSCLMSLGDCERAAGEPMVAQELSQQACHIFRSSLGDKHPLLAGALNNLAQAHRAQGRYDQALLLMQQSVGIKEEVMSPNHPSLATGISNLAAIWEQGYKDLDKSLELRKKALEMTKKALGDEHPQVATHLNNLAVTHTKRGDYEAAIDLYQQALTIDENVYGDHHPQVATDLNNLATFHFHIGQWQLSRQLYERALSIRSSVLGADHVKTCATQRNLNLVLQSLEVDEQEGGESDE